MRILLAGETWMTTTTVINGANVIPGRTTETDSATTLVAALTRSGFTVDRVPSARVAAEFPDTAAALAQYDAVMIGDVGADSFTLAPPLYDTGLPQPDRLQAICDYVEAGGGLLTIGGYLSYSGIAGLAGFGRTPLAAILPVTLLDADDRVERPGGVIPTTVRPDHPILEGVGATWPPLLGYNKLRAHPGATVPLVVDDSPLLTLGTHGLGRVAAFSSDCAPHWASTAFLAWSSYGTFFSNIAWWLSGMSSGKED